MKIYSIKEIVQATNNILNSKPEASLKTNNETKKIKLSPETENIIIEAEKSILQQEKNIQNVEKALVLKNEISITNDSKINPSNYKIKIKPEAKDHMINELYLYLKRKVRKNTLKLIIEEQLEIKNLKNEINFLKKIESELKNNYEILKNNHEILKNHYKSALENNKELKINNDVLQNELNEVTKNKENDLNEVTKNKESLDIKNKELKIKLKETRKNLKDSLEKNRSFEINNAEIKSTLSRYIVNYKKLEEKISLVKDSKNLKLEKELQKVKFYQDENTRLSSELLSMQKRNDIFKENFKNIEMEKEKISSKIKDLNKSIEEKTNIISSPIIKTSSEVAKKDIEKLDDKEQKSLDEAINRIFAKV